MKRLASLIIMTVFAATLALAQTGGDKSTLNPQPLPPGRHPQTATTTETSKKGHKGGKKGHKGGKKSKKGSSGSTTPPPK
ncbi:MAG TPA: hypothetical protein VJA94_19925 [Candidatus Angelobacter sp.]